MKWRAIGVGSESSGQSLVEYALIVAGISILMVLLMNSFGRDLIDSAAAAVDRWV